MKEVKETIRIYSYSKIWKLENKIYAIQNIQLPAPVSPTQLMYFGGTAAFMLLICKIIPFFDAVPAILRYGAVPLMLSNFLITKKLDGKNPIKYFVGFLSFLFTESGSRLERFQEKKGKEKPIRIEWVTSEGSQ